MEVGLSAACRKNKGEMVNANHILETGLISGFYGQLTRNQCVWIDHFMHQMSVAMVGQLGHQVRCSSSLWWSINKTWSQIWKTCYYGMNLPRERLQHLSALTSRFETGTSFNQVFWRSLCSNWHGCSFLGMFLARPINQWRVTADGGLQGNTKFRGEVPVAVCVCVLYIWMSHLT